MSTVCTITGTGFSIARLAFAVSACSSVIAPAFTAPARRAHRSGTAPTGTGASSSTQDRHQHQRHQPERAAHRLQRTSQQQPHLPPDDILQHQHHQPAAGKAEADHVAHQVGTKNVVPALVRKREEQRDAAQRPPQRSTAASATRQTTSGAASDAGSVRGPWWASCPPASP